MKLATFDVATPVGAIRRIGAVSGEYMVDLNAAYAAFLKMKGIGHHKEVAGVVIPPDMIQFIEGGDETLAAAREAVAFAEECIKKGKVSCCAQGTRLYYKHEDIILKAPIPRPRKFIETGSNYQDHVNELNTTKAPGWGDMKDFLTGHRIPSGFLKAPNAVIGHGEDILYPHRTTKELDYENELTIIVGKKGRYIPEEKALDYILGYTVHNDVSARDIQAREQSNRLVLLGKSMDTMAPIGPYIVTKDEVGDTSHLHMQTFVDGEIRQDFYTSNMIHKVPQVVSWWSQLTLEPGDLITTATGGGAAFCRDDREKYFLRPGQTIEMRIENVGTLINKIVVDENKYADAE